MTRAGGGAGDAGDGAGGGGGRPPDVRARGGGAGRRGDGGFGAAAACGALPLASRLVSPWAAAPAPLEAPPGVALASAAGGAATSGGSGETTGDEGVLASVLISYAESVTGERDGMGAAAEVGRRKPEAATPPSMNDKSGSGQ